MIEHRDGVEFRVAGRTLTGTALRYGDISPDFGERFEPGSFGEVRSVPINLQHDSIDRRRSGSSASRTPPAR